MSEARGTAAQRGYGVAWQKARAGHLRHNPWCMIHLRMGQKVRATVVDHIKPHRGDRKLFWDRANWQSCCKSCHDSVKQAIEKGGAPQYGCDVNGMPNDPAHHWRRP